MKILFLSDFLPSEKLKLSEKFVQLLNESDAIIFNLEGSPLIPFGDNKENQIMPFKVDSLLEFLKRFGENKFHLALANNHIYDNGKSGFDLLVKVLEENQINYFGTK